MSEGERLLDAMNAYDVDDSGTNSPSYSDFDDSICKKPRRRSSVFDLPPLLLSKCQAKHLRAFCKHFLPTSLYAVIHNKPRTSKELRKTAALDGLRGISAFSVVLYHFFGYFYPINFGFIIGYPPSNSFWNLPIVKYIYHGSAAVHVFFVISGYILSLRSLQQIKKQDMEGFVKTLSSSTFRRSFRLLAPISISMFIEMCALQLGMFEPARSNAQLARFVPLPAASLKIKFAQYVDNLQALGNFFNWADYHNSNFDDNLWTIAFEYRCSMALFLLLLAICRIYKPWLRRSLLVSLTMICRMYDRWDFILFIVGIVLADFDAFSDNDSESTISGKHQPFWALISIAGLHLCSYPMMANAEIALGFRHVAPLARLVYPTFPFRFAWSIGAGCLVAGAMHSIYLRYILESRAIQYLGQISYMLYIVHGPLLRSLGFMIVSSLWGCMSPTVTPDSMAYPIGIGLGFILFLTVLLWLADLCTRLIDNNCVSLARWIETQCTKRD